MFTSFEYLNSDTIVVSLSIDWSRLDNYNISVLIFLSVFFLSVLRIQFYGDMDHLSVITT
jgi:hypothetical protein